MPDRPTKPFKSKAQARYLFANHPQIAEEKAQVTRFKVIPERLKKKKEKKGDTKSK